MQDQAIPRARDISPDEVTPEIELQAQLYALAGVPGKEGEFEALRLKIEALKSPQEPGDAVG